MGIKEYFNKIKEESKAQMKYKPMVFEEFKNDFIKAYKNPKNFIGMAVVFGGNKELEFIIDHKVDMKRKFYYYQSILKNNINYHIINPIAFANENTIEETINKLKEICSSKLIKKEND